jgi:hypothetical protein
MPAEYRGSACRVGRSFARREPPRYPRSWMSSSKTILGFTGNSPTSDPPAGADSSDPRVSRTIIGHDLHRPTGQVEPRPSAPVPVQRTSAARSDSPVPAPRASSARPSASSAVVTQAVEEVTEQIPGRRPSHSGKTGFPAFARLFGRWTTGGTFHRRSSMDAESEDISVPRDPWAQRFVVLFGAALLSFLIALGVVRLHQCATGPLPSVRPPAAAPSSPPPAAFAPRPQPSPITPTLTAQATAAPSVASEPPRPAARPAPASSGGKSPSGEARPKPSASRSDSRAKNSAPLRPVHPSPSPVKQPDPDSLLPLAL